MEELEVMPINLLRNIDIQSKEEEDMVQRVYNKRQLDMPIDVDINITSSMTDDLTPEKEAILQAEIDAKKAARRQELEGSPVSDYVSQETTETEIVETKTVPFCQFCDAKGPIRHKANCTRSKLSTNNPTN